MSIIAARDLRNHTAEVLRRVSDVEHITVTQHGRPVAEIAPVAPSRPRYFTRAELSETLGRRQADAALRDDLAALAGDTTDDLDPL